MSTGLIKTPHQHLILTGAGVIPTIPTPVTAQPGDPTWVWATDIMRGQLAYNTTDDIWYYRTVADTILKLCTAIEERTALVLLTSLTPFDNTITFSTPFADANWWFGGIPLCFDSTGGTVIPTISNKTANGFDINIGDTGSCEYIVKHL